MEMGRMKRVPDTRAPSWMEAWTSHFNFLGHVKWMLALKTDAPYSHLKLLLLINDVASGTAAGAYRLLCGRS